MSLRQDLVEVGADVLQDAGHLEPFASQYAAAVLDAMLDLLTKRADEWKAAAYEHYSTTDPDVFGSAALAVLR
jgi:hypothetical protein